MPVPAPADAPTQTVTGALSAGYDAGTHLAAASWRHLAPGVASRWHAPTVSARFFLGQHSQTKLASRHISTLQEDM